VGDHSSASAASRAGSLSRQPGIRKRNAIAPRFDLRMTCSRCTGRARSRARYPSGGWRDAEPATIARPSCGPIRPRDEVGDEHVPESRRVVGHWKARDEGVEARPVALLDGSGASSCRAARRPDLAISTSTAVMRASSRATPSATCSAVQPGSPSSARAASCCSRSLARSPTVVSKRLRRRTSASASVDSRARAAARSRSSTSLSSS